jgi:hypothetical protein
MVMPRKPAITVVIPTYNWSAALACAIRSVLQQTVQDFELFVVGDGCTDDSESVVASFNDARIRWHNLDRNYGSQWAANNFAAERAAGDWIAYLGHDDIWYPTHLAAILDTAHREAADIVTSTMILYGPPGSGIRGIAGIFSRGVFSPGDFVPPSAFAHATAVFGDGVIWRDPEMIAMPMDVAFLSEIAFSGRAMAATHELTCFKFNAGWRRDSYRTKPVAEQSRMLERINSGIDFRQAELLDVLQASASGRFVGTFSPATEGVEKGAFLRLNRRVKGLDSHFDRSALQHIDAPTRFDMSGQEMPFEWHPLEVYENGSLRWTGPLPRATIDLPIVFDRDLAIRIHIPAVMQPDAVDSITLSIHDNTLQGRIAPVDNGYLLEAVVRRADIAEEGAGFGVTIEVPATLRPFDLGQSSDMRWLGVAVGWIELAPA